MGKGLSKMLTPRLSCGHLAAEIGHPWPPGWHVGHSSEHGGGPTALGCPVLLVFCARGSASLAGLNGPRTNQYQVAVLVLLALQWPRTPSLMNE